MRVTEIANPYTSLLRIKNPQRRDVPETYMKKIKWMEPLDKSDKDWYDYMKQPTEQRVRALSALSDMKEMGLNINDPNSFDIYFSLPKHDHNYDQLIETFGKKTNT